MKGAGATPHPTNTMETIRALQKRYCSRAMLIAIGGALLLLVLGYKPLARGLILGTLFSIINFVLMGQSLQARIGKTQSRPTLVALVSVVFRYALMAVPLIIALLYEPYHIATAIMGLFMVQMVILLEGARNLIWNRSSTTGIGN